MHELAAMDTLTALAASGMRSRMESLEMLANNIANASTGGYKSDREFYSLYAAPEADGPPWNTMPVIEQPWTDFSQGTLQPTGNDLDLALSGSGFFAVNGPGVPLYTRNGSFHLAPDGKLTTAEGYPVRGSDGADLTIGGVGPIQISSDGTITRDGNVAGKLDIADFTNTAELRKRGSQYFRAADNSQRRGVAAGTTVQQGHLEASNAGSSEAAVRLISIMRQFEMLQRAVSMGAEMDRRATQDVARVGS